MDEGGSELTRQLTVDAYKAFSFLVFEIDRDNSITGIWAQDDDNEAHFRSQYLGIKTSEIRHDSLLNVNSQYIARAFGSGEKGLIEYNTERDGTPVKYFIRIIPAPYSKDHVLTLLEIVDRESSTEMAEDKWRLALDASGDGMWDMNPEEGKIYFSPKWHELFGYSENEITTTSEWSNKIHPDDLAAAQRAMEDYENGLRPSYIAEVRYKCNDGSYRWILSRGIIASRTPEGKPTRFIGTHTDINERKLQELRIKESEQRYKALFEYSEAMICTHDMEGNIININPFVTRALGYAPEELIGTNLSSLIPVQFRSNFDEFYLSPIKAKGAAEGLMHILNKQGETKILHFNNHLFSDEHEKPYIIGFAQDITGRVRAEEALKNSVDTFYSAFNHSGIGMAITGNNRRWIEVNEALCAITGYSKQELLELNFEGITHPEDISQDQPYIKRMLSREIDAYTIEKRYISKQGKIVWISLTLSLVWNKDATPKFFIAQMVDITRSKELTTELENAQKSLLNKVAQLEELSYIIAHNLRGPARNINLFTEILKVKSGGTSASEDVAMMSEVMTQEEGVTMLGEAAASLMGSLESLLDIAEISLNKDIPFDDCNIEEILQNVTSQLKADIVDKNVLISKDFDLEHIHYPHPYLESLVYNLVSNAIKYSAPERQPHITITTKGTENNVVLSVKDNGLGIDLEKYGHKVFKLNQVFHTKENAKGIGLHLIKTQVEALGGSITLNSKVNVGTEFIVTLGKGNN